LLYRFQEIQEKEKTDLIGSFQHSFKKNFSTETACLEIQTKLSNACDNGVLFISPLADITAPTTYADDNFSSEKAGKKSNGMLVKSSLRNYSMQYSNGLCLLIC
jgi:hypothetical protein